MKKFIFVAPEFHSIPPNYAAAVEWWIYNVAKISQANNLIICKGERTEKTVEKISEYSTIHRIYTSAIYKRFFRKWSRLDPYPYVKRVIDTVSCSQNQPHDKPILIIQNSVSLYNEIKQYYPEEQMVLHLHNKHNVTTLGTEVKLITPSHFLADFFRNEAKLENIKVVPNGIDKMLYMQQSCWKRERFGLKNTAKIILYAGRLDKRKGVLELMEAVSLLHKKDTQITLLLIGEHTKNTKGEREIYRKKVVDKALEMTECCVLAGNIPPANMHQVYSLADLTVVPSLWEEPFCMVALESMARGTPVLASPRGGIKEFVVPNNTGFLLQEPLSPESIAQDILDTLSDSRLHDVTEKGKEMALTNYDWHTVSESLTTVLSEWF
ncbi:glycosyltransferase [Xenorhabdus sp. XENO-10]|uniref:Glycosyltransferase n=1 Tax=Xenorhabdus yunnanensis TaxID=3025878 RepID=A0ABT5LLS2_9GAMM|nr:glycosyltransferase [Xenorhabdus yunnanensis]MDC9590715.1 glycosyltransferase [Xenorhabdus yunnanensis]